MTYDPQPIFLLEGEQHGRLLVMEAGYYVDPPCDPDCCEATGPFPDMVEARKWALQNKPDWL